MGYHHDSDTFADPYAAGKSLVSRTPTPAPADAPTLPAAEEAGSLTEDGLVVAGVLPDDALAAPGPELAHPDGSTVERCFGFVDICAFTAYTAGEGTDAAVARLREFRELVRTVASTRGVRIAKWLGDGCMVVGVAPGPVVATLAECLVRFNSPLRAGVAAGPVLLFEADDHIGPAVNLAARLCDLAEPGELLASGEVVPFSPSWTDAHEVPPVELRGLGQVEGLHLVTVSPSVRTTLDATGAPTRGLR